MIDISTFPEKDSDWSDEQWFLFLQYMKELGLVSYKEIASTTLSALNPPQVGTQVASKKSFQKHFASRQTMKHVFQWLYAQSGVCEDCGTRLELQADHIQPKETFENPEDADFLENLELRCRRCNVIKRPSHVNGGKTFLTAAAALMWILFTKRPDSYEKYKQLCRKYGLTMADIRFQEAWAIAEWLHKENRYEIADDETEE